MAKKNKPVTGFKEITILANPNWIHIIAGNVDKKISWSNFAVAIDSKLGITTHFDIIDALITALDSAVVHKAGSETITGPKIFSASPKVPNTPADGDSAVNKDWVLSKIAVGGNINGSLSAGRFTVAIDADTIGSGRAIQTPTQIFIESPDTNAYLLVENNNVYLNGNGGVIEVTNALAQLLTPDGHFIVDPTKARLGHNNYLEFDSAVKFSSLTAKGLLLLDASNNIQSIALGGNGTVPVSNGTTVTWQSYATYTKGNGIDLAANKISLTFLTDPWDTGKGIVIGGEEWAIDLDGDKSTNGIQGVFDGDGINFKSKTRAITGFGLGNGAGVHAESETGPAISIKGGIEYLTGDATDRQTLLFDEATKTFKPGDIPVPDVDTTELENKIQDVKETLDGFLPTAIYATPRFALTSTVNTSTDYNVASSSMRGGSLKQFEDCAQFECVFIPPTTSGNIKLGFYLSGHATHDRTIAINASGSPIKLTATIIRTGADTVRYFFEWNFGTHLDYTQTGLAYFDDTTYVYDFSNDLDVNFIANKLALSGNIKAVHAKGYITPGEKIF